MGRAAWWRAVLVVVAALMVAAVPGLAGWSTPARAASGDTVEIAVFLQGDEAYEGAAGGSCVGGWMYASITVGTEEIPLVDGVRLTASDSPTGERGCRFDVTVDLGSETAIPVAVGWTALGVVTQEALAALDNRLEIALMETSSSHQETGWRFANGVMEDTGVGHRPKVVPGEYGRIGVSDWFHLGMTVTIPGKEGETFLIVDGKCNGIGAYAAYQVGAEVMILGTTMPTQERVYLAADPTAKAGECRFVFSAELFRTALYFVRFPVNSGPGLGWTQLEETGWQVEIEAPLPV